MYTLHIHSTAIPAIIIIMCCYKTVDLYWHLSSYLVSFCPKKWLNKFSFGSRKFWSLAKLGKQILTPALAEIEGVGGVSISRKKVLRRCKVQR